MNIGVDDRIIATDHLHGGQFGIDLYQSYPLETEPGRSISSIGDAIDCKSAVGALDILLHQFWHMHHTMGKAIELASCTLSGGKTVKSEQSLHVVTHRPPHQVVDLAATEVVVGTIGCDAIELVALLFLLPDIVAVQLVGIPVPVLRGVGHLDITLEAIDVCHLRLGSPEASHATGSLEAAGAEFADHHRQLFDLPVLADVIDKCGESFGIGSGLVLVDHVIPALEPDQSADLVALILIAGIDRLDIVQHSIDVLHHLAVELAGPAHRWRQEILRHILATPGGLDQQHWLIEGISQHGTDGQFGTDPRSVGSGLRSIPHRQRTASTEVIDEHIVSDDPLAILLDVGEQVTVLGILTEVLEGVDCPLALHVRLTSKDENLHRCRGIRQNKGGNHDDKNQQNQVTHRVLLYRVLKVE